MAYKKVDGIYRQVEEEPVSEQPKGKAQQKTEDSSEKETTKKRGGK